MMQVPKELKYTREHEWVKLEGNTATIGITDYAQQQMTDIVFVELPEIGKEAVKDRTIANIESVKSVSDVYAPVSGVVTEVNENLSNSPEQINSDPYGAGWIAKIEMKDPEELDTLMSADEYEKHASATTK